MQKRTKRSKKGGSKKGQLPTISTKTLKTRLPKIANAKKCSPLVAGKTASRNTCYTVNMLQKIKSAYNKNNPLNKIVVKSPDDIWFELKKKLDTECSTEHCWLNELSDKKVAGNIKKYIFLPEMPPSWKKQKNEWLSNVDISNALKPYCDLHTEFEFIGPVSIDFDSVINGQCVDPSLCKIDLVESSKKGKTKIGIIFNTDKHTGSGQHWISMFVDLEQKFVFYFDSAGSVLPKEIVALKDKLLKQDASLKYYTNVPVEYQYGNTECGMYSLFFIITMLTRKVEFIDGTLSDDAVFNLFQKTPIPDEYIEKYRTIYFEKI